jgi:hypothetical protein
MARSVSNINEYIIANLVSNFADIGIIIDPNLWSKRNVLRVICYTIAVCQALLEQLQDLFRQEIEETVSKAAAPSATWVQDRMFKFQYSATTPQVITLIDTIPTYSIVDDSLKIIKACSVTSDVSNDVSIKIAKGNPLVSLDNAEISSAQGYINTIGAIGITYNIISLNPDKLFISAEVFYAGQYASVIKQRVIDAINLFLINLSITNFNGALKMSDLEIVIRRVTGVNDIVLKNVRGRLDTDPFSAGVDFILNTAILQKEFVSTAGYISEETTPGQTFIDSLIFTAQ